MWRGTITKRKYDAIVVGGGISGLLVGGLLAKKGLETLIVEKGPTLGGACRPFKWRGFRCDMITHEHIFNFKEVEDTWLVRALAMLGVRLKENRISWTICSVNKKGEEKPTYETLDFGLGVEGLINFWAVMTGSKFNEKQVSELRKYLRQMGEMSAETCRQLSNTPITEWTAKNVSDPVIRTFFHGGALHAGINIANYSAGHLIGSMGSIQKGNFGFAYPAEGALMDTLINPLEEACQKFGCDIATNTTAVQVFTEKRSVSGAWLMENQTSILHKVNAQVVVCTVHLDKALGTMLDDKDFTLNERRFVKMIKKGQWVDYNAFYFLKEVIPADFPAYVVTFDWSTGGPIYLGDVYILLGANPWIGATGPKGKQLLFMYLMGGKEGPFGGDRPPYQTIRKTAEYFEEQIEKMIPGFRKAIEYKTDIYAGGNWGRFSLQKHDPNDTVEVKSRAVKGLYFSGDTLFVPAPPDIGLEKCARLAVECTNTILEDVGKN
jgi:glycine/D-amino acid oxidase-like deaminating enzyme